MDDFSLDSSTSEVKSKKKTKNSVRNFQLSDMTGFTYHTVHIFTVVPGSFLSSLVEEEEQDTRG